MSDCLKTLQRSNVDDSYNKILRILRTHTYSVKIKIANIWLVVFIVI